MTKTAYTMFDWMFPGSTLWLTGTMLANGGTVEDALKTAGGQVPALVVLCIVVYFFLKAQGSASDNFLKAQESARKDYLDSLKEVGAMARSQFDTLHRDTLATLDRQAAAAEKQAVAVTELAKNLLTCKYKVQ